MPLLTLPNGKNSEMHINCNFIEDGILNLQEWNKESSKIMFLGKEAYGDYQNLPVLIEELGAFSNWYTVANWTYVIHHVLQQNEIPDFVPNDWEFHTKWLRKIAFVNIKKSSGASGSDHENLHQYAKADKLRLKTQINTIDPDIILCCYTYDYYTMIYEQEHDSIKCVSEWCFEHQCGSKKRLIIDYWHFSNQFPNKLAFYALAASLIKYKRKTNSHEATLLIPPSREEV